VIFNPAVAVRRLGDIAGEERRSAFAERQMHCPPDCRGRAILKLHLYSGVDRDRLPAERERAPPGWQRGRLSAYTRSAPSAISGPCDHQSRTRNRSASLDDPRPLCSSAPAAGWVHLATPGNAIARRHPSFNAKAHGHATLGQLVEALGLFEVQKVPGEKNPNVQIWSVRLPDPPSTAAPQPSAVGSGPLPPLNWFPDATAQP